jgi:hypothetical protein
MMKGTLSGNTGANLALLVSDGNSKRERSQDRTDVCSVMVSRTEAKETAERSWLQDYLSVYKLQSGTPT